MTADNNSFVLYTNYFEILSELSTEDAGHIFKAILEYKATGNFKIPNHLTIAFKFIKNQLDLDNTKYKEKCEKAKANGSKGGRPKNQKNQTVLEKSNGLFKKHNDNDNDNDNDNVNDNDNDNDNVNDNVCDEKKIKPDLFINPIKTFFEETYKKEFGNKPLLSQTDCNRIIELSANNSDIRELIPIAIQRLKDIEFEDINFTPTASWLLKNNNFERVINGEFKPKKSQSQLLRERLRLCEKT